MSEPVSSSLWLWCHPRPEGGAGRCYGQCDLPVDRRQAKRLAHRIRQVARRQALPHVVWTSPLTRCRDVGQWLRRWGWQHRVDAALSELHFGAWEGRPWSELPREDIDTWVQDFAKHAPGGGEALPVFADRVRRFMQAHAGHCTLVVAHGGWMVMARWLTDQPDRAFTAADWSAAPPYGSCWVNPPAVLQTSRPRRPR